MQECTHAQYAHKLVPEHGLYVCNIHIMQVDFGLGLSDAGVRTVCMYVCTCNYVRM